MMPKFWREWQRPIELSLLLLFVFYLPLREAPKNIFWALYILTWIINRARERNFGPRWDGWDTLNVLWISASYLAALLGSIHRGDGNELLAVNDLVKYVALAWCLRRAGYTRQEALTLLGALVFSCVITEIEALWNWRVVGKRKALELYSVGQVNHSAIYMAICLGICTGLALSLWRRLAGYLRIGLVAGGVLMLGGLMITGSRAAAVMGLLLVCVLAAIGGRAMRLGRVVWAGALLVIAAAMLAGGTGAIERQIENAAANNILTERDLIWNRGLVAWRGTPWFGVGPDNYSQIKERDLRAQLAAEGKPFVAKEYAGAPHAHSIYINTLVERGLFGFATLMAVLLGWAVALWRRRPQPGIAPEDLALWCASFSGWFVTIGIGFVNTTLHHEHALLAMMTLGLWLSFARAPAASARAQPAEAAPARA